MLIIGQYDKEGIIKHCRRFLKSDAIMFVSIPGGFAIVPIKFHGRNVFE